VAYKSESQNYTIKSSTNSSVGIQVYKIVGSV